MSTYLVERIEKPKFFQIEPLRKGRGNRRVQVIGFDTEQDTRTARPMLLQFSRDGDESNVELRTVPDRDEHDALHEFMRYVHANCTHKGTEYVIVGFNLKYEFTQLFGDLPPDLNSLDEYEFRYRLENASGLLIASYIVRVMSERRYGVVITNESTHRRVKVIDASAFWDKLSLDKVAAMLDIGRKISVDTKRFTRDDLANEHFLNYARQDAYLTRKIGEYIIDLHEMFDVPTCITAPHFAARVFRRHFLTERVPLPDPDLEQAGLWSYHGGKNGYYLNEPKHLSGVYSFDITSAYPEAMRQLPNIETARWEWTEGYRPGVHALWSVKARYRSCRYRGIMQHGNAWCETGEIDYVWTTSYELDAAVAEGEIEIIDCVGWLMNGDPGGPLTEYVDRFFTMKRESTGAKRNAAKLFLNSLYGKFFQKVALGIVGYYDAETLDELGNVRYVETDPTQEFDWQAGGLYHPPIASLITGYVRAKMHRLEHKYGSLMTSTDGFFAIRAPDPQDVGTDLGKLTVERGDLSIWRERLYHFKGRAKDAKPKFALHGFRGKLDELLRIPLKVGAYRYGAVQVITNKLALKAFKGQRFRAGTFAELEFTLDLTADRAPP
jgi:hypothetical protein